MENFLIHEQSYRSENLIKKITETSLVICGCGAIGSNLIDNMVRQGFSKITVIDMDRIESHNRGSQIWNKADVGALKVERMKTLAYSSTGIILTPISKKVAVDNVKKLIGTPNIIVDAFDNPESRGVLYNYSSTEKIPCIHAGLNTDYAEIIWNDNYTVPKKTGVDVCEYPLARNITMLSVIVCTESIIRFIETGRKENYTITLKDLKIRSYEC